MSNYSIKLDLLKIRGAFRHTLKGKTEKDCIIIPIQDAGLYAGAKGVYLNIKAWENRNYNSYGETHGLKQNLSKELYESLTEEERKNLPYIGNMKPEEQILPQQPQQTYQQPQQPTMDETVSDDDFPF